MKVRNLKEGRSGFTLVELLVVILIISVLAGFLVPTVMSGRTRVRRVQCTNRLSNLGKLSQLYADDNHSWFPVKQIDDPLACESLQLLVEFLEEAQNPELFQCPASGDRLAKVNKNESPPFVLSERNLSYAWRNTDLKFGTSAMLGCDNSIAIKEQGIEENHDDGMNVLYADSAVKWLTLKGDLEKNNADYSDGGIDGFLSANKLGM